MLAKVQTQHLPLGILYGVLPALSFAIMRVCVKKIGHALPAATTTSGK